ncbi:MAG: glutamate--tRNA ligase family protein, partial [Candidatus Micrarchaeia archaeon]
FQGAVMDSIQGITHPIRSKEYELRDEAYIFLLNKLGLKVPHMISISRLAIKNAPISKRLLRPLVESKKLSGWDDPRLPTLAGLRTRGILPEAIRNFVLSFGISKVESEPSWEALLVENKKLLEPVSKHYFFVPEPVKIKVKNAPEQKALLKMHPKNESLGTREIETDGELFIPKRDFDLIAEGETFRLKDLYNAKMIEKKTGASTEAKTNNTKASGNCEFAGDGMVEKKIQWVTNENVKCEVLIPKDLVDGEGKFREDSLEIVNGICENACLELNIGDIIQFERFGFCRLNKKTKTKLVFVLSC